MFPIRTTFLYLSFELILLVRVISLYTCILYLSIIYYIRKSIRILAWVFLLCTRIIIFHSNFTFISRVHTTLTMNWQFLIRNSYWYIRICFVCHIRTPYNFVIIPNIVETWHYCSCSAFIFSNERIERGKSKNRFETVQFEFSKNENAREAWLKPINDGQRDLNY